LLELIKKLNHRAKIIESSYGKVDVKQLVNTGMFNLQVAQSGYGWLQDLHAMTVREVGHAPQILNVLRALTVTGQWTQCPYA
jgi:G3E family GTPase